tara:strand:+ start:754 stop:942 length:189 start_codon:yes stop_codon:yes gene_type:complete
MNEVPMKRYEEKQKSYLPAVVMRLVHDGHRLKTSGFDRSGTIRRDSFTGNNLVTLVRATLSV